MKLTRLTMLCQLLLLCLCAAPLTPAQADSNRIVLQNHLVRRVLEREGGTWRTISFSRVNGKDAVKVRSDEFLIRLMDGKELTVSDYRADKPTLVHDGPFQMLWINYHPAHTLPDGAPTAILIRYYLIPRPYFQKTIDLKMPQNGAVDRLEVERFKTDLPCTRGGRGEPVFIGSAWFSGLEYPGSGTDGKDGLVTLAHFPGLAKQYPMGPWHIASKTAVIGTGLEGDPLDLAFSDYLDTIRQPARSLLHYNSWFDLRGKEVSPPNILSAYDGFKKNLLDPYGLKMDSFVPDDGWQDPQSIWTPRKDVYPEGFAPLGRELERRGSHLGIWLPFNGTNLDTTWGAGQGYEKSDQGNYYCLVGPKYNAALRDALQRNITTGGLNYMKHDFNHLRCAAPGHGHLPDDVHGHEANLDAELDLMAFERRIKPDIFLNITSNVWFSPWWLQHADSIWMQADDYGYNKTWPQLSPREWDTSYRDHHLYGVYAVQHHLVPVSALMTHGIIHGRYNKLGGDAETVREWSDGAVMYYARGVQLKELYITPSMMPADWWRPLGEATRWAVENQSLLNRVVMVGGDCAKGEVYGYAHVDGDRAIIALRNPDLAEQSITIPFDKSIRYRGAAGRSFGGRVIYPYVEPLQDRFVSGGPLHFTIPGASVMVYELSPGKPLPAAKIEHPGPGIPASARLDGSHITAHLTLPAEAMQRCDLVLLLRSAGRASSSLGKPQLQINDAAVSARTSEGPGWAMYSLDLRSQLGKTLDFSAQLPTADATAFGDPAPKVSLWLVADRPVGHPDSKHQPSNHQPSKHQPSKHQPSNHQPSNHEPSNHLPFPIAQSFRRQTIPLLLNAQPGVTPTAASRHLTEGDLAGIKAAKLHIDLFGTDAAEPYLHKFIYLNGQKLVQVPVHAEDNWATSIIDLTPDQFKLLKGENTLELDNSGGDDYKFTGLALAVQLADGTWVQSSRDDTVYSSAGDWLYTEGKVFQGRRSGPIVVRFE